MCPPSHEAPVSSEAVARLIDASHDDPFAVLGPHRHGRSRWVTAIAPGAAELAAVVDGQSHALGRIDGPVFSGKVAGNKPYRLRGTDPDGRVWEYEDAYRFGPVLSADDEYFISEGTHERLWQALGAHPTRIDGVDGTHFAVWAPSARRVSVVGEFNAWDGRCHSMRRRGTSGVWEIFVPGIADGQPYKYEIRGPDGVVQPLKADPVAFRATHPPMTSSVVSDIAGYGWTDDDWMQSRRTRNRRDQPISVYEVHLGSWRRLQGDKNRPLSYRELAEELVAYACDMGFTHLELLPVSEFPFDGSWGYQPIGLYAPTIRFGPPHEFRDLVNAAHRAGLGVILDWVPGHFPTDAHGLGRFDGTPLYEYADPREGFHMDWNTLIYNYGRTEVQNFLVANALFWLEEYHVDGLRVDAVASMLYRDYSRSDGEWVPNRDGGRENYEAIAFLQRVNRLSYGKHPGIMTAAEESTSFPGVSAPVDAGGLGFGYKWNMGWMNDTLEYMQHEPVYRKHHHHQLTFGINYAFSENFVLPISHDEVVHGKGSMLEKMPGSGGDRFANLRAYYGFMWGHPGKKLLFMGCEFAQPEEWNHDAQLNWQAAATDPHRGVQTLVRDLNRLYRATPALHAKDCEPEGFEWIDGGNAEHSVLSFLRRGGPSDAPCVVVCNFTPIERSSYRVGLPSGGHWREILNTDSAAYGGADRGNFGGVEAHKQPCHGQPFSVEMTLPPLATLIFMAGQ